MTKVWMASLLALFALICLVGTVEAQGRRISSGSYFGCVSRDYFTKLVSYIAQKDSDAFKQGLAAGIVAGACTMFNAGEEVFIADTAIFSGLVKVRRRGEVAEYWTNIEAVKSK